MRDEDVGATASDDPATVPVGDDPGPSPPETRLHVILDRPEIAGNVGAVGRTCVAVGASLWLIRPLGFHLDDPHRRRAGLDYWEHLELRVVNAFEEVAEVVGHDRIWAFSTRSTLPFTSVRYRAGDALLFGPESRGLPARLLEARPDRVVRIPIRPEARSLNLSVSAAVGLFEAVRQIEAAD